MAHAPDCMVSPLLGSLALQPRPTTRGFPPDSGADIKRRIDQQEITDVTYQVHATRDEYTALRKFWRENEALQFTMRDPETGDIKSFSFTAAPAGQLRGNALAMVVAIALERFD